MEVVNAMDGKWVVGIIDPNSFRRRAGQMMVERSLGPNSAVVVRMFLFGRLTMQGFRRIAVFPLWYSDGHIVAELKEADYNYRHIAESTVEKKLRAIDGRDEMDRRRAYAKELATTEGLDAWKFGRKMEGFTKGPSVTVTTDLKN